ncbi:hypothetical protein BDN70DRAFT_926725 [Pholiota conissans]|uniref:Pali-domain-containing protein n=1 Tax=Pholiota conissans TaxID=109636 RepID=A0A9P5ZDX9_9AGAR|nr:hypothetical protein BDN70DRAFT_926725 [Pholiota conissans]
MTSSLQSLQTNRSLTKKFPHFNLQAFFRSRSNVLRAALLFFVLSSVFLLFFGAFSIPYVNAVYFVKATFDSVPETVTLGTFGLCLEFRGVKECSGYQTNELIIPSPIGIPKFSATIINALALHVVSFVLSLVVATIILCAHFQNSILARWLVETVLLLTLFVAITFIVELAFFFMVRKALSTPVEIGNGTWLTFTSFIFLLMGMGVSILLPKPARMSDLENPDDGSEVSWLDNPRVLDITPSASEKGEEEDGKHLSDLSFASPDPSVKPHKKTNFHNQPLWEKDMWTETRGTTAEELPALSPVRRLPSILVNGEARPRESTIHRSPLTSTVYPSSSSLEPTSGYAPSTYSTCPSDGTSTGTTTPQTLSRSSTAISGSASRRQNARRSTQDWFNFENRMGKRYGRFSSSRQFRSSVSTLGSVIQHFPISPSPQPILPTASFAFRDRFFEADPSRNAEARSIISAVPSSDLELDLQTVPPTPKTTVPRELPRIPVHSQFPHSPISDTFSLA